MSEISQMTSELRHFLKDASREAYVADVYLKADARKINDTTEVDICITSRDGFTEGASITQDTINPRTKKHTTEIYDLEGGRYIYHNAPYTEDTTLPPPASTSFSREYLSPLDLACARQLLDLFGNSQE